MAYCINCGTEIKDGYEFCPECGCKVGSGNNGIDMSVDSTDDKRKVCKHCGEKMPKDAFYCLACGETFDSENFEDIRQRVMSANVPQRRVIDTSVGEWRNKWIALILCIFFGVFGIHRFYEGKKITGFIYLFSFGLCGLGVFFDMILIATKNNPYRVK